MAKKDFPKAFKRFKKSNRYKLDKQENHSIFLKLGYATHDGDSNGAIDALEDVLKIPKGKKCDVAYMLGHLYYANQQNDKAFQFFDEIKDNEKYASW